MRNILSSIGVSTLSRTSAVVTAVALLVDLVALWQMTTTTQALLAAKNERYLAALYGEELRWNADTLTRMARAFVATGDADYRRRHEQIIQIRDGIMPRPPDYELTWWDPVDIHAVKTFDNGSRISLMELLSDLGLTDQERSLLNTAKMQSDDVNALETFAMNIMSGRGPKTSADGKTIYDKDYALAFLFSPTYHKERAEIMRPIASFYKLQSERLDNEVSSLLSRHALSTHIALMTTLFALIIAVTSHGIVNIYIVTPMRNIALVLDRICSGAIEQSIPYLNWENEVGIVARNTDNFRKQAELQQRAVDMDFFVKVAAHDLRGPISNALLVTQLLDKYTAKGAPDAKTSGYIHKLKTTLNNLLALLDKLRSMTKLGSQALTFEPVRALDVIHEIQDNRDDLSSDVIEVVTHGDITLNGSRELLRNLFENVMTNAVYYGTVPKVITFDYDEDDDCKKITIRNYTENTYDNPGGLVAPFKRGVDKGHDGSGLGLAICKRIMELHNGELRISMPKSDLFEVCLMFRGTA